MFYFVHREVRRTIVMQKMYYYNIDCCIYKGLIIVSLEIAIELYKQ